MIGTVCDATSHGSTARSKALDVVSSTANPSPISAPSSNPSSVSRPVKNALYGTVVGSESGQYKRGMSASN